MEKVHILRLPVKKMILNIPFNAFLYSGTESKRIVISSYDSQGVQLKSGSYRIVASVDASRVRNFCRERRFDLGESIV